MDSSRFWNTVRSLEDWKWTRDLWELGQMRTIDYLPGAYHYAMGDATRAYTAVKVRRFTRELLYIPAQNVLLVFDRVASTNANFRKAWLLHGVNEPRVSGPQERMADGSTASENANSFLFADGSGEILVHSLLPRKRTVISRGGPGHEFWAPGAITAANGDQVKSGR